MSPKLISAQCSLYITQQKHTCTHMCRRTRAHPPNKPCALTCPYVPATTSVFPQTPASCIGHGANMHVIMQQRCTYHKKSSTHAMEARTPPYVLKRTHAPQQTCMQAYISGLADWANTLPKHDYLCLCKHAQVTEEGMRVGIVVDHLGYYHAGRHCQCILPGLPHLERLF